MIIRYIRVRSAILLLLPLLPLLPIPASADPITVTLLDQTTQLNVHAGNNEQGCNIATPSLGPVTCSLRGTTIYDVAYASASITPAPSNPFVPGLPSPVLSASSAAGCCAATFGVATVNVSDTVLIGGGTGIGYLNVDFAYSTSFDPNQSGAHLQIGAQVATGTEWLSTTPQLWGVVSFQFGQPFTFNYGISTATDSYSSLGGGGITMQFAGAQIYTSPPTECGERAPGGELPPEWGLCSDPNFTSANVLGTIYGIDAVPEPNTIWLTLALLPLAPLFAGRLRHHAR